MIVEDPLWTEEEAAKYLGLSPYTLSKDRVVATLGIPFVRIGKRAVRYRKSALDGWADERTVIPGVDAA